jgi:hypothetical protein
VLALTALAGVVAATTRDDGLNADAVDAAVLGARVAIETLLVALAAGRGVMNAAILDTAVVGRDVAIVAVVMLVATCGVLAQC